MSRTTDKTRERWLCDADNARVAPPTAPQLLVLPAAAVLGIILGFGIYTASAGKAAGSPNDVRQIHRCMPLAVAAPAAPATPCC